MREAIELNTYVRGGSLYLQGGGRNKERGRTRYPNWGLLNNPNIYGGGPNYILSSSISQNKFGSLSRVKIKGGINGEVGKQRGLRAGGRTAEMLKKQGRAC